MLQVEHRKVALEKVREQYSDEEERYSKKDPWNIYCTMSLSELDYKLQISVIVKMKAQKNWLALTEIQGE